jgi:hypothetical protein
MKKNANNIDTGRLINSYRLKEKLSLAELSRILQKTPVGAANYTRNKSIQTSTLIDISYALRHNFFQELANALPRDFTINQLKDPAKETQEQEQKDLIAQLQEENNVLKIQNELLMKLSNT